MEDDFLHPECLLHTRLTHVQSIFTQDDREAVAFGLGAETQIHKTSSVKPDKSGMGLTPSRTDRFQPDLDGFGPVTSIYFICGEIKMLIKKGHKQGWDD